jgi:hypothetical protein
MVLILAKNYNFSERYILEDLPVVNALRYYHAAIWSEGAWTVKAANKDQLDKAEELLNKLKRYGKEPTSPIIF